MSSREPQRYLRRSRSPAKQLNAPISRSRSRSPQIRHHSSKKHSRSSRSVILPFQASKLHKDDFGVYRPMFGLYLDIQKQLDIEQLPDAEIRGRWKSFLRKCVILVYPGILYPSFDGLTSVRNVGELAEGWYDPATLQKAQSSAAAFSPAVAPPTSRPGKPNQINSDPSNESSDGDSVGPALPGNERALHQRGRKSGPAIPDLQDLDFQREMVKEGWSDHRELTRQGRLHDLKLHRERLDDLIPRAEPGSKDRMLEKKREKADGNRAFATTRAEAGMVDLPEADLLGGEDGGVEGFKQQKREMERKKNERELRREEILRARQVEREQRVMEYKAKEEKTMSGLVALAKARFG